MRGRIAASINASDVTARDRSDWRLAYVWCEVDGNPSMLNEVLMPSEWGRDVNCGDRRPGLQADHGPAISGCVTGPAQL